MNKFKTLLLTAALAACALPALAVEEIAVWAGGGTDVSTTLCYTVVSANGKNQGIPVLTYLSATSDKAGSIVQFYTVGTPVQANYVSTTTNLFVGSTNGFASGDVVVIRHLTGDTYERRVLSTQGTTNLTVTAAPTVALAVGDLVYKATATGSIPCGAATLTLGPGEGIYAGQAGKPLLLEIDCTSAGQINAAAAKYEK